MTRLGHSVPKINPWALRPTLGGPLVALNGGTSFRLATCKFMVDIKATPAHLTTHYHGLPSAPRSRNAIVKSQRPCLRHVPPEKGNFPARFRAPLSVK